MADTGLHKAACACGRLSVEVTGEPEFMPICGCSHCRKRTGSVYGAGAYYNNAQVHAINGDSSRMRLRTAGGGGRLLRRVRIAAAPSGGVYRAYSELGGVR